MTSNTEEQLYAEIGRFVVEFEGLLKFIKDAIQDYFKDEGLYDTIPIEMLMHDSTSAPLAKYFQAISLHYLDKKHSDKKRGDIELVKKFVNSIHSKLIQAGELRNDIVHASWYLSSYYGINPELEANRIKITKDGAVMRKLHIQPGILDNVIWMTNHLGYFIQAVQNVISDGALPVSFHLIEEDIISFNKINFESERKNLFTDDISHYKRILKDSEEMRALFNNKQ